MAAWQRGSGSHTRPSSSAMHSRLSSYASSALPGSRIPSAIASACAAANTSALNCAWSFSLAKLMASCSKGQIGALNAESFCERVLSQSNLVMTDGNTLLSDEEIEMVVILRVNREVMEFMREQQEVTDHLKTTLPGQTHNMTVVTEEDNGDEMCDSVP